MKRTHLLLFLVFLVSPISSRQPHTLAEEPPNQDTPFQTALKAAEQGDATAQYVLGVMYYDGEGVAQNYKKAIEWFTKGAEQDYASAQTRLAMMYEQGEGVPQDYKKAAHWFTKAAEQDDDVAQLFLGIMYFMGQGVQLDNSKSAHWLSKSAGQGNAMSQVRLGSMYSAGKGVPQDDKKAAEWFTKAAEQGHADAQLKLGLLYMHNFGLGVSQNYEKAAHWLTKAAEQGNVIAQFRLGSMYSAGKGVPQDYEKAAHWKTRAAEQGYTRAQLSLSVMHYRGIGVIEDYVESYKWLLLAGKKSQDIPKFKDDILKFKDILRKEMTSAQIAKAQSLAKQFVVKSTSTSESDKRATVPGVKGRGTGFFVSSNGYVITTAHVVEKTERIKLWNRGIETSARVVYQDAALDIAVLKADKPNVSFLPIVSSSNTKAGEKVFTLGFPQVAIQGSEVKYTEGSINALSGIGGNQRVFQISIPVQPGNSGGPVLNSKGEVVGVISSRLDDIAMLIKTGAIPQNVNYAIKSSFVLPFLDNLKGFASEKKPMPSQQVELIGEVKKAVVLVICY